LNNTLILKKDCCVYWRKLIHIEIFLILTST
jgi:hypothetical protein